MLSRQFPAKPPHANAQYCGQHQNDAAHRDGRNDAEHDKSTNRKHADNNDEYIGNRIAGGDMPVC